MGTLFRLLAVASWASAFPQASWAEGDGAPIERRLRIVLQSGDGAAADPAQPTAAAGSASPPPVAAEMLPEVPLPPREPEPIAMASSDFAPSPEWTEDELRTPLRPGEGWRIQVGAFSESARAEARIAELELTAAGPGADPVRLVVPAGAVYRAQMSGFVDRAAADAACGRIEATGAGCFVVAPQ